MPIPHSPPGDDSGKGLRTPILLDPLAERKDIGLVSQAIRKRWKIPDELKDEIVNRLGRIVSKEFVEVMSKDGPVALAGPADIAAVAAARVLASLESMNQRDELVAAESSKKAAGDTFNIGCFGQIALGQEPITPEDAKRQAQEILAAVRARAGQLPVPVSPPAQANVVIDAPQSSVTPEPPPQRPWGLDDL